MHSSLYLSLLAIVYFYISFEVIKHRRISQSAYGYGSKDNRLLAAHVSAHSNFAAYTPIFFILLFIAENQWAMPIWIVHPVGVLFLISRLLHFRSLSKLEHQEPPVFTFRIVSMMITFGCLLGLALYILARYLIVLMQT